MIRLRYAPASSTKCKNRERISERLRNPPLSTKSPMIWSKKMRHPTQSQVLVQIARLEQFIDDWQMLPATDDARNRVFLALYSKALTVGRAVCSLVKTGYPAEAFGLSRTLIDIFFSIRYMSNRDTKARIATFVDYGSRVTKEWINLNAKYFPNRNLKLSATHKEMMKVAERFRSRNQWTSHGGGAKFMALEDDAFEVGEDGKPITAEFDYDAFYFWTSQYVHVTCPSLKGHAGEPGTVFRVPSNTSTERDLARLALFNTVTFLTKISIQACRGMHEEQPEAILRVMSKMMSKFEME